jgi:hypothetical protein
MEVEDDIMFTSVDLPESTGPTIIAYAINPKSHMDGQNEKNREVSYHRSRCVFLTSCFLTIDKESTYLLVVIAIVIR